MQQKMKFRVLGAKKFKGDVEGTFYDSTKLFVVMDVSEKSGTAVGQSVLEMPFGKSDEFDQICKLPFPLEAELDVNMTIRGYECEGFKHIPAPKG